MIKYSIRYYLDHKIRAVWDKKYNTWWYSAVDVIFAITNSKNPRIYWNALKRRHNKLNTFCRQLKLFADDGKKYLSDVINEKGIKELGYIIRTTNESFINWLKGSLDPLDEQSKKKAYELFNTSLIEKDEIGKTIALQKIHGYLFEGLYEFAGQIRTRTISKGGFIFANGDYLPETLNTIDSMKDNNLEEIINKYIEMNIAHPFMEGNGRATRIWLDLLLIDRLKVCVDWSKIDKKEYLKSMKESPNNDKKIKKLIKNALTKDINNKELFMKGIDTSYYYEDVDE